jgi:hypothetical protein
VTTPDKYHPKLVPDFKLTLYGPHNSLTFHHSHAQGDYLVFYDTLLNSHWQCVLNDAAVYNMTAILLEANLVFLLHKKPAFRIGFLN